MAITYIPAKDKGKSFSEMGAGLGQILMAIALARKQKLEQAVNPVAEYIKEYGYGPEVEDKFEGPLQRNWYEKLYRRLPAGEQRTPKQMEAYQYSQLSPEQQKEVIMQKLKLSPSPDARLTNERLIAQAEAEKARRGEEDYAKKEAAMNEIFFKLMSSARITDPQTGRVRPLQSGEAQRIAMGKVVGGSYPPDLVWEQAAEKRPIERTRYRNAKSGERWPIGTRLEYDVDEAGNEVPGSVRERWQPQQPKVQSESEAADIEFKTINSIGDDAHKQAVTETAMQMPDKVEITQVPGMPPQIRFKDPTAATFYYNRRRVIEKTLVEFWKKRKRLPEDFEYPEIPAPGVEAAPAPAPTSKKGEGAVEGTTSSGIKYKFKP